jgi:hypothetical protein
MIDPDGRFICRDGIIMSYKSCANMHVYDADQRRWFIVDFPSCDELELGSETLDDTWAEYLAKAEAFAREHVDKVEADVVRFEVDRSQRVTLDTNPYPDWNDFTAYYPPLEEYQLGNKIRTVLRSELTELDRLCVHVDLVSYPGVERAVFKYGYHYGGFGTTWQELHIHARLPRHPNILPLECVVLEEVSGTRPVGFTTPFIPGDDLDRNKTRPFKLKYLKQLMKVIHVASPIPPLFTRCHLQPKPTLTI